MIWCKLEAFCEIAHVFHSQVLQYCQYRMFLTRFWEQSLPLYPTIIIPKSGTLYIVYNRVVDQRSIVTKKYLQLHGNWERNIEQIWQ